VGPRPSSPRGGTGSCFSRAITAKSLLEWRSASFREGDGACGEQFPLSTLHLRPNDLLHWRAIEWACAEGLTKYGLGATSLFLRKFGGEVVPTTRHRLDRTLFRRHTVGDWVADRVEEARPFIPQQVVGLALCGAISRSSAMTAADARYNSGALPPSRRSFKGAKRKPLRWCTR